MKSVLISIQPKWCELIARGEKTVEVRKTRPKLETPFKCYIYCTYGAIKKMPKDYLKEHLEEGKVIGEFVCDEIMDARDMGGDEFYKKSCLTYNDWRKYTDGTKNTIWLWHISDLVIYDKPRELGEFYQYCGDNPKCDGCEAHYYSNTECGLEDYCCSIVEGCKPLKRPFQSWGYVYETDT